MMWWFWFPFPTGTSTSRSSRSNECAGCGQDVATVPDADGYESEHCRRCADDIERREGSLVADDA